MVFGSSLEGEDGNTLAGHWVQKATQYKSTLMEAIELMNQARRAMWSEADTDTVKCIEAADKLDQFLDKMQRQGLVSRIPLPDTENS